MSGIYIGRRATLLASIDILLIVGAIYLSYALRFLDLRGVLHGKILADWTGASALVIALHLLAFYVFELYNLQLDFRRITNLLRCVGAVGTAAGAVASLSFVLPNWGFGRGMFLLHAVLLTGLTVATRGLFSTVLARRQPPVKALLVIGGGALATEMVAELSSNPESRFHVVGAVPGVEERPSGISKVTPIPLGTFTDCETILKREDARHIIVAGLDALPPGTVRELLRLKTAGYEVLELTRLFMQLSGRVPIEHVDEAYFLRVPGFTEDHKKVLSNFLRVLDVSVASALLLASLPLWALALVGIKLTMPGPVFFSQERVGRNEAEYRVFKFRTMVLDAEKDGPRWATKNDARVTPFGRFLRRTRIDELPQLWNVLRGDMSLVGPRPERRHFVEQLKQQIPHYGLRFVLKPGLTGWAQVNYGYGATIQDAKVKLSYDLYYIQERSVLLFALTLLKTATTVLFKPGS